GSGRPVGPHRLRPSAGLWSRLPLVSVRSIFLATTVTLLAGLLAIITLLFSLFFCSPLRRQPPFCVLIGAFPGAMPPLIGWASATGTLSLEAWMLYATLFFWQFPHFMAIAWMYRDDYDRAGYFVLPHGQASIRFVVLATMFTLV